MNQATNPHPQAELLKAAARDVDALFQFLREPAEVNANGDPQYWSDPYFKIDAVLRYPDRTWRLYQKPEVEEVYYDLIANAELVKFRNPPDLERWDLKLTFTDGRLTGAEVAK